MMKESNSNDSIISSETKPEVFAMKDKILQLVAFLPNVASNLTKLCGVRGIGNKCRRLNFL